MQQIPEKKDRHFVLNYDFARVQVIQVQSFV